LAVAAFALVLWRGFTDQAWLTIAFDSSIATPTVTPPVSAEMEANWRP